MFIFLLRLFAIHHPPAARGRTACWRLEKTVGSDARLDYCAITKRFS
jgi:hypothetical protein